MISITDPVVSISSTLANGMADRRRHHWSLKETWQTAGQLSPSRLNLQFYNRFTILLGLSIWLTWQLMFRASIQSFKSLCHPWFCRPLAVPACNQFSVERSSHIDGTKLLCWVLIFSSVHTKCCPTIVKMLMEGNENLLCHLEQQVADKSWLVRLDKSYWAAHLTWLFPRVVLWAPDFGQQQMAKWKVVLP